MENWTRGSRLAACPPAATDGFRFGMTRWRRALDSVSEKAARRGNDACFARLPRLKDLEGRALTEATRAVATVRGRSEKARFRRGIDTERGNSRAFQRVSGAFPHWEGGSRRGNSRAGSTLSVRIGKSCGYTAAS